MKDIENSGTPTVATALDRLTGALARLEAAAGGIAGPAEVAALRAEAARLTAAHASLKDAAGRVAARLDQTIDRLAATEPEAE